MALYNEVLSEFSRHNAQMIDLSVGVWCDIAFHGDRKLRFPLLAHFEPKGAVARLHKAYRAFEGTSERALFAIDAEGIIRWSLLLAGRDQPFG